MTQTRVAQVIDAVIAKLRARAGYRGPDTASLDPALTVVYDGAEVFATDDPASTWVVIGYGGTADDVEVSATSTLSAGPIASTSRPRDETTVISCRAVAQSGESQKAARDAALLMLSDVADVCRADPSLGINTADTIGGVRTSCYVTTGSLAQYLREGYVADWAFTINYQARV